MEKLLWHVLVLLVHVVVHLLLPPVFEKKEFHGVAMILTKFADFIYLFSLYWRLFIKK